MGLRTKNAACCGDNVTVILDYINTTDLIWLVPLWMLLCGWIVLKSFPNRLLVLLRLMKPRTSSCSVEETWKLLPRTDCSGDDTAFYCAERLDYPICNRQLLPRHLGRNCTWKCCPTSFRFSQETNKSSDGGIMQTSVKVPVEWGGESIEMLLCYLLTLSCMGALSRFNNHCHWFQRKAL